MFLTHMTRRGRHSLSCLWLVLLLVLAQLHPAQAQAQLPVQNPAPAGDLKAPQAPQARGINWKTCEPQAMCFPSKEARQQWAEQHQCKFLEDICEGKPPRLNNQGAKDEGKGFFWGELWGDIKDGLVYGYEFVQGLKDGLASQATDLWDAIVNFEEVVTGMIELAKAFYHDPEGTLQSLARILGQEAVDTIKRATQCGPYDMGKVLGENLNPITALKLFTKVGKIARLAKLAKYDGKLDLDAAIKDIDCTSFAAGTLVLTPQGMVPIEKIRAGQQVQSRHDSLFIDAPQTVTKTFSRTAPGYQLLTTEFDSFKLTGEHPLWVQGKGWTQAQHITDDDVIAGASGDVLVLSNAPVKQALVVHNFSVAKTANYFVGSGSVWAHNVSCKLSRYTPPKSPSGYKIGASDGGLGKWVEVDRPDSADFDYEKKITGAPKSVEYEVNGVKFDGYDAKRDVLLDAKNYSADNFLMKEKVPDFFVKDILKQAKNQRRAVGDSAAIEWHVANKEVADKLKTLLEKGDDDHPNPNIKIVFTPNTKN